MTLAHRARRFHRLNCDTCGACIEIASSFLYTDFGRDQCVLVGTPSEIATWPTLEAHLANTLAHVFDRGSPLAHTLAARLQRRVVFGYEELREKLVLWDAAYDDRLIECVKLQAIAADPSLALARSRLLVTSVAADDRIDLAWFERADATAPAHTFVVPAPWWQSVHTSRASLEARYPDLFRGGFVSYARYLL